MTVLFCKVFSYEEILQFYPVDYAHRLIVKLACEQALIFVVIIDVARAAKPRVTSRRA